MKKLIIFFIAVTFIAGIASAQPIREQQDNEQKREVSSQVRNEHRREINPETRNEHRRDVNPENRNRQLPERSPVTVNGIIDGTNITVQGYRFRNFILPEKISIDGRTYNLAHPGYRFGNYNQNHKWDNHGHNRNNHRNSPKNHRNNPNSCCCR